MNKKIIILFAGAPGSSKTPIAHYLSWKFNLPIFSNDSIRSEINEEFDSFNDQEYKKRRDSRLRELADKNFSFIYDASIDRSWSYLNRQVKELGYQAFIISLDLNKKLLTSLYKRKGYKTSKI